MSKNDKKCQKISKKMGSEPPHLSPSSVVAPSLQIDSETLSCQLQKQELVVKESGTVRTKGLAKFNFGPGSHLDDILYTACQPGYHVKTTPISTQDTVEWIEHVKSRGIQQVVSLMNDEELSNYKPVALSDILRNAGFIVYQQPMKAPGACHSVLELIRKAHDRQEKILIHCKAGCGRSGRVAAAWVYHFHGIDNLLEATNVVLQDAVAHGLCRKGNIEMLQEWMETTGSPSP